jgi:hypothetical protein
MLKISPCCAGWPVPGWVHGSGNKLQVLRIRSRALATLGARMRQLAWQLQVLRISSSNHLLSPIMYSRHVAHLLES